MKRFHLIAFVSILLAGIVLLSCDTASNIEDPASKYFVKYYGEDGNQSAADLCLLNDGSALLLGNSDFNGEKRIYLVKVDARGQQLWAKRYSGTADVAIDLEPTPDGNFVILARYEKSSTDHDVRVMIVDPDGNEINNVSYGTSQLKKEAPKTITPLSAGGFIITGATQADTSTAPTVNPDDYLNIFHFRCDSKLIFDNTTWYELYGAVDNIDVGIKAFETTNGKILIFGYSNQIFVPGQLGKFTPVYYEIGNGGIVNSRPSILGDFSQDIVADYVLQVDPNVGGGFLVMSTKTNGLGGVSLQAAKLREPIVFDPSKDEQFDEEISVVTNPTNAVAAGAVTKSAPQGFLLLGEETRILGTTNISLTKIDQSAQVKWSVSLGSEEENDRAAAVAELPDGRILVLGTVDLGDNQSKIALFKLNSTGQLHD